jgi:SAM-dependent methyltransferase
MGDGIPSVWDVDGGEAARAYAEAPYGHHTEEVYSLFGRILDGMGDGIRVLDIGAGPGHFAVEFYRSRPGSSVRFVLLDVGKALLDIARERLRELGVEAEFLVRDINHAGWHKDLNGFQAIVSNNVLFHVTPNRLQEFYAILHRLLGQDGVLLNHQTFGPEDERSRSAKEGMPEILGTGEGWPEEKRRRSAAAGERAKDAMAAAESTRRELLARLRAQGNSILPDTPAYAGLGVSATRHVEHMRAAGFAAEPVWRKMDSAVVMGIKGRPFAGARP